MTTTEVTASDTPAADPASPLLSLKRVAIDTYRENVAYLHRDCAVYRAEGFQALSKVEVSANGRRILASHVLPNLMHLILIALVMDFSGLVLAEAVLSYVGIGVDPNTISFGTMINAARMELAREPMVWWSLMAAFIFMFVLVLAANLFADVVRDAFDPRAS